MCVCLCVYTNTMCLSATFIMACTKFALDQLMKYDKSLF